MTPQIQLILIKLKYDLYPHKKDCFSTNKQKKNSHLFFNLLLKFAAKKHKIVSCWNLKGLN
jgi:hypothetical protein